MSMVRAFLVISVLLLAAVSCVKKPSTSPQPVIRYIDFQAAKVNNIDTAVLVIGYEDGDGDIFRDQTANGPNVVGTFYYLNSATKQFMTIKDPITNDTMRITQTVVQPKENNQVLYKGKSVSGEIYLPWSPFRSGDSVKVFFYTIFMEDEAGHKSNVVSTPVFTINF